MFYLLLCIGNILISHSNNHIQDVLVVSYLANTIRTQIDLSNRLATATIITPGGGDAPAGGDNDNKKGGDRDQKRGGGQRNDNRNDNRDNRNNRQPREPREPREQ